MVLGKDPCAASAAFCGSRSLYDGALEQMLDLPPGYFKNVS
jgi:hypothetical protein